MCDLTKPALQMLQKCTLTAGGARVGAGDGGLDASDNVTVDVTTDPT